jgi:hypothetical protein
VDDVDECILYEWLQVKIMERLIGTLKCKAGSCLQLDNAYGRVQTCVEGERYACLPSLLVLAHDEKSRKHQPIVVSASTHQQK